MLVSRRLILGAVGTLPLLRAARAGAPAEPVAHRLTILHMNDFHSRHLPVDGRAMTCAAGPSDCFGGAARLATAILEQRRAAEADGRAVLLVDAGDQFQGSLFFTAHHGLAELAVQHAIGTEAMSLGNHEFDDGPATLGRYAGQARFPIVAANVDARGEPALAGCIRPWAMVEKAGLLVALIGLTTQETAITSSPGPNVRFLDPAPALAQATAEARAAGAQLIVVLSHLGLEADRQLAAPGVAVIVGGHSHSLLSNDEPGAVGPDPTPGQAGVLIVQAQAYGRYLGRLDLDLAADGGVLAHAGACRHIGQDVAEDPGVAAIVARFAAPLEALRRRPVATLPATLDVAGCRVGPCPLGALAAESLRGGVHRAPGGVPVVGLMNAGGLRVGLPAGAVTLGQVLDTLPFGNTLATATVSGAELLAVVRHGLSMTGRGGYAQWAGLRVVLPGLDVEVEQDGAWQRVDPAGRYLVATNNFVRLGGDGYTVLRDRGQDAYDSGPALSDLVAEALTRASPP